MKEHYSAQKASRNKAGVEHATSIDPGSLKIGFLVLIQDAGFVRENSKN